MSVTMTVESPNYLGRFTQKVDSSRRVVVPSRWLPAKTDESGNPFEFTLVVWPAGNNGTCLRVLPPKQMDKLLAKIEELPDSDPRKLPQKRFIGANSMSAPVDKQGRIVLPEDMAATAGIGGEVVMLGCVDKFEMWSAEASKTVQTSDSVVAKESLTMWG